MIVVQPRNNKTKAFAIIIAIIGVIILISSIVTTIGISKYYLDSVYSSFFTYLLGVVFGRMGWGIHFGITLILIGLFLVKPRRLNLVASLETENTVESSGGRNDLSVLEWFGTLILLAIPLVNLIMLLIWAFGSENPKKNFARANFLYSIIVAMIAVIVAITVYQMYPY
ncbi:hypothetical protein ACFFF5_14300 [Lederbergia wuyishanensis]|uniref:Polyferredoxin n=1 Tax=Lederbergia wuyishanensis TaxID=1347903 RepID=A0ABU0D9K7_9BACI|nr:hypothetical protein [Lederbergia wuyishanensis]MCJ8007463.1 hypothetical protein [Lederbergia wuyishanensis]MDQ0345098.1 polyferredoxin [Lederbergia wuyishanensis]